MKLLKKGQINRGTVLGEKIYEFSKKEDVKIILEIGTCNGMGSTKCIYDGVIGTDKQIYSIECNKERYEEAKVNLGKLPINFNLIHGTIVNVEELIPILKILENETLRNWLEEDIKHIKKAPNVFNQLPEKIDLYIIDGGEFSGNIEFFKLWKRCRFIILDDTNSIKHRETRKFILENPDQFHIIEDNINERNGFLICENKKLC